MTSADIDDSLRDAIAQSRKRFNAAANELRPRLHRFCSRMCRSALDGEDVVQETLAEAFYGLSTLRDASRLEPWLFRIAYNKCIDHLRREGRHEADVMFSDEHDTARDADEPGLDAPVDDALASLVGDLPPKERAAVVLADILDYPLADIAEIADSTLGGAKAALHRGRTKLRALKERPAIGALDAGQRRLFDAYADCFNRRDWLALRELVRADARLEIVGEAEGRMAGLGATYSGNYTSLPWEWRLSVSHVDGEMVILHSRRTASGWEPHTAIRLWWEDGHVVRIRDYIHVGYLLR